LMSAAKDRDDQKSKGAIFWSNNKGGNL